MHATHTCFEGLWTDNFYKTLSSIKTVNIQLKYLSLISQMVFITDIYSVVVEKIRRSVLPESIYNKYFWNLYMSYTKKLSVLRHPYFIDATNTNRRCIIFEKVKNLFMICELFVNWMKFLNITAMVEHGQFWQFSVSQFWSRPSWYLFARGGFFGENKG